MGRRNRLIHAWAIAVAVGIAAGAAFGPARASATAQPPATATAGNADVPAELPADFGVPAPMPGVPASKPSPSTAPASIPPAGQLGPEAPSAGPRPAADATPAAPAKPGLSGALGKLWAKGKDQSAATKGKDQPPAPKDRDADVSRTQATGPAPRAAAVAPPAATPVEEPPLPAPAAGIPAELGAASPLPPPADAAAAAAPQDKAVDPAQAPGQPIAPAATPAEANPLPAATVPPAASGNALPTATPGAPAEPRVPFVLPAEETPLGRQSVGLTVDVVAPQVLNLNQTANYKIIVRNNGQSDARGVIVRDRLPEGLSFVSSTPAAEQAESLLVWNLGTVPAGSEKIIALSAKPGHTGAFDHAATVTMMAASKARTIVREPKLKVEQTVASGPVLKGQPVPFKIAVSNPGDGPARNITVQAKLSPGLRHESGEANDQNLLEMTIDLLNPGDRVILDTLVADAIAGGEQTCTVAVSSADVVAGAPDARSVQTVNVVEPRLKMTIAGPDTRYTDMLATYDITLENPGTAPAQNIRVQAVIPVSVRLKQLPSGASFDRQSRRLSWVRPALQPGAKDVLSFQVLMGGVGQYQIGAEARADNVALAKDIKLTDVTGLADVDVNVVEKRRVVDVDEETTYVIKLTNAGTKEATKLQVRAVLSGNLVPTQTMGTEEQAQFDQKDTVVFPIIERLGPGKSMELGVRVKVRAADPKLATCRVFVLHDDLSKRDELEDVAAFKITPTRR